jgi:multiple sugar transport system permease protein
LRAFFLDIPETLEEAAWIDGCSRMKAFIWIFLPLAMPSIAATGIFCIIMSSSDFIFALILTRNIALTIPVQMYFFSTPYGIQWGPAAAMTMLAITPIFILALVAQKYLVRVMTLGAVKR